MGEPPVLRFERKPCASTSFCFLLFIAHLFSSCLGFFCVLLPLPLTFPETRRLFKKIYSVYVCTVYSISFCEREIAAECCCCRRGLAVADGFSSLSLLLSSPKFPHFRTCHCHSTRSSSSHDLDLLRSTTAARTNR